MSWRAFLAFFTGYVVGTSVCLTLSDTEHPGSAVAPAYVTVEKAYQVDLILPHGYNIAVDSLGGVTIYRLSEDTNG